MFIPIPEMTSETVASHYNAVKQEGIEERKNSKIFHLRNINNWMKNCLISQLNPFRFILTLCEFQTVEIHLLDSVVHGGSNCN